MNSFETKKERLLDYLLNNYSVYRFVNNFAALLLCKINVLDFFEARDCFQICVTSRSTVIESNYWLGIYMPHIPKAALRIHFQPKV